MTRKKARTKDRDLLDQRDAHLFEAYNLVLKSYGRDATLIPKNALCEKATEKPAPRFYISPKQASMIINKMLRNGCNSGK